MLPNAAPPVPVLPPRDELRRRFGVDGDVLAFAGRLTPAESLETALDAVGRVPGVTLLIAGDGEERARLERLAGENVRFLGAVNRTTCSSSSPQRTRLCSRRHGRTFLTPSSRRSLSALP